MPPALRHELKRLTRALRQHYAVRGASWGILTVLSSGMLVAMAARLWPLWYREDLLLVLIWGIGSGAFLGSMIGYVWPQPLPRRLRSFDARLHLADRLTTAWELTQGYIEAPTTLVDMQVKDTLSALTQVNPQTSYPLAPPRKILGGISAAFLILALMLFLPNPQEVELARQQAQQHAIAETVQHLETAQQTLTQNPALSEAEREAALQALEQALQTLQSQHSTPEMQQLALAEAERQLAQLRSPDAEGQIQHIAEAAPLVTAEIVQPLVTALQQGDIQAAVEYLRSITDPNSGDPLTAEEAQTLADTFAQMADMLQNADPELAEQFRDISEEIYQGDTRGATEAIEHAAETLSDIAQANTTNQALEQAQASVQQAQEQLATSQQPMLAQSGPSDGAETPMSASSGEQGRENTTGGGAGSSGHHEDAGSSAPYGPDEASRIAGQGGEITLPREEIEGLPQSTTGAVSPARVPYQDVYGNYAQAAEAELSRQTYPHALRAYIHAYFSGLEP